MKSAKAFEDAYKSLNKEQKEAVDTVEGPVLVIAGPGTGKTHILTLRIANILKKTDAKADSILVLTFTDSAARTVGRRLAGLVGEETARKVSVFTFHSFAEAVMKQYPEAFPEYTEYRLMGEVEQVLLWRSVLEGREVKHLSTPKAPFHYLSDLKNLEEELTRECIALPEYRAWVDEEVERIQENPQFQYVKGERKGELNGAGAKRIERLFKAHEAIELIEAYRNEKDALAVYGYTDMLAMCADALKLDEALRADLQERYQYVLADEHQDANALQHALLDSLAYDEHPNLFVVGDEKQAIFGFQGADSTHFKTFLSRYPRTKVIALTENFRSYQSILDLSHTLLHELPSALGEHAKLKAKRGEGGSMHLLTSPDALAERDQVATLVAEAIQAGTPPHEIAVITMKNRTADLFALHLRARGVPALRAGTVHLEGRPLVRLLLALMHTVGDPNDHVSLREALLAPWWREPLSSRTLFLRQHRDSELPEALARAFPDISRVIEELRSEASVMPPVSVFSRILIDSGARAYVLSRPESVEQDVPLVRQLTLHIEELSRRSPNATFSEVMDSFRKAREHEIGNIKTSLTQKEGQITVITAHKAKGMEFEKVFVASLTQGEWESRGRAALIPSMFDTVREKEEVVRLFYVALTRAKNELVLSYPAFTAEGKETKPISLLPSGLPTIDVPVDLLPELAPHTDAPEMVRELTLQYLQTDGLSPSAYNEYLTSPATFFARRVLRLREPETRAIVVGNAVHAAIATYLQGNDAEAAHRELARCLKRSLLPRGDTFEALSRHARKSFDAYVKSDLHSRKPVAVEEYFSVTRKVGKEEVLLKGRVDAVFAGEEGEPASPRGECIVDFKTSSTLTEKEAYERQLAFYDLLLRENGHQTISALIVQVGEDKVTDHPVALNESTRSELAGTLSQVLTELVEGRWRAGEPSEYDELLKLFEN